MTSKPINPDRGCHDAFPAVHAKSAGVNSPASMPSLTLVSGNVHGEKVSDRLVLNQENTRPLWACLNFRPSGMLGVKPSERCQQIPLDLRAELGSSSNSKTVDAGTIGGKHRCSSTVHPKTGRRHGSRVIDGATQDKEIA